MTYKPAPFISWDKHGIVILQTVSENNQVNTDCIFYADARQTKKILKQLPVSVSDELLIKHCLRNTPLPLARGELKNESHE